MRLNNMMVILLALCMALFAGCGGGGGGSDDDDSDAATWPVEFYSEVGGGSPALAFKVAPATGVYKYIYFFKNKTYESGDLNNGTLTKTGEGTYSGGDPHDNITIQLTGSFEGSNLIGESVAISTGSITIAGVAFTRTTGGNNGGGNGGNGGGNISVGPWLCFEAVDGSVNVKLILESIDGIMSAVPSLEYSKDGSTWNPIVLENPANDDFTINDITTLADGSKVYIRATSTNAFMSEDREVSATFEFSGSGKIKASGNIMSLLDKTCESKTITSERCFSRLFYECTKLLTPPELPATTLAESCYSHMFMGCTSLTTAPELPATTLADSCYRYMFKGCTSLTTASKLPATTLADVCYEKMFEGCSELTTAPVLPATTLVNECYRGMFSDCTALASITIHFDDWNEAEYSTRGWVDGVADTGTFYYKSGLTPLTEDEDHIPAGWTKTPLP